MRRGALPALLRYLPEWLVGLASSVGLVVAVLHLTDARYFGVSSFMERSNLIEQAAPAWHRPLNLLLNLWIYGELLVILTNRKRRAIHDFIAGTVVIRDPPPGDIPAANPPASHAQLNRRLDPSGAGD